MAMLSQTAITMIMAQEPRRLLAARSRRRIFFLLRRAEIITLKG
jgi:hypothetical protein